MPSADFCTAIRLSLDRPSTRQLHRSPRVMRVTFLLYPPHIQPSIPNDMGLWTPALPYPCLTASDTVRVPRVRSLPSASFRSHLRVGTLAVRLEVPVIKASKGLAPSSHFPVGFRLLVASARQGATRHAWRTPGSQAPSPMPSPQRTKRACFQARRSRDDKSVLGTLRQLVLPSRYALGAVAP